jgi:myosin heavy subunit
VPKERTSPFYESHEEDYDDAALMDHLEEAPLLDLLRRRFRADKIYTFSSNMVVSVNPYKPIAGLYDDLSAPPSTSAVPPPPHLYTIAGRGYRDMLSSGNSQSILMSGESGAGKTEATKLVVRYLITSQEVQTRSRKGAGGGRGAEHARVVEEAVVCSVPLLEAFGNARTINNVNSSRFGKFLKIVYSSAGAVQGALSSTFLLEKSRVVKQCTGERNFHAFYLLCTQANDTERAALQLSADPSTYHFLNQGGAGIVTADQPDGLAAIRSGLAAVGLSAAEIADVFKLLAGVLHLGNVQYDSSEVGAGSAAGTSYAVRSAGGEASISASPASSAALHATMTLLGLPEAVLRFALTQRTMYAGKRKSMSTIPLTQQQAVDSRNALAKAIYERLFLYLVHRVNQATNPSADSPAVVASGVEVATAAGAAAGSTSSGTQPFFAILDIFGFEVLEFNGYVRCCFLRAALSPFPPPLHVHMHAHHAPCVVPRVSCGALLRRGHRRVDVGSESLTTPSSAHPVCLPRVDQLRAAVHQLHERGAAALLHPERVRPGDEGVRAAGVV